MKLRNKWAGMTVKVAGKAFITSTPSEALEITEVLFQIGGSEFECELTAEEALSNIKNIKVLSDTIKEVVMDWIVTGVEIKETVETFINKKSTSRPTTAPEDIIIVPATATDTHVADALRDSGVTLDNPFFTNEKEQTPTAEEQDIPKQSLSERIEAAKNTVKGIFK
jgi:hypothetical protein